jgi:hypothetical protein
VGFYGRSVADLALLWEAYGIREAAADGAVLDADVEAVHQDAELGLAPLERGLDGLGRQLLRFRFGRRVSTGDGGAARLARRRAGRVGRRRPA